MNNQTSQSKETPPSSNKITSKTVDPKVPDSNRTADQLNPKLQPTAEQLRIAQMIGDSKKDDPDLPRKVNQLVELTNCSADAAIIALHDANNDLDCAIVALLEGETEGDWEVSGKKKKSKQSTQQTAPSAGEGEAGNGGVASGRGREWNRDRERSRSSRGGPPRLRGRGRGRDNKENVEEGDGDTFNGTRGRGSRGGPRTSNGPGRETSGGRGGSRSGRGGYGRRGPRAASSTETWEDGNTNDGYSLMTNVESWGVQDFPSAEDWDNEEYIGSLVETKVFTPSQAASAATPVAANVPESSPLTNGSSQIGSSVEAATSQVHYSAVNNSTQQGIDLNALLQKTAVSGGAVVQQQYLQYSQATDALKAAMGVVSSSSKSKTLRSKIPPPSKIPLSAVEMPDDPLVAGLDVKFGTLDFGIETSGFDINLDAPLAPTASSNSSSKQPDQQHGLMSKMEQYGSNSTVAQQPPAPSSLPKPDPAMGGFSSSVPSAASSLVTAASQVKSTTSPASYPYGGTSYAPPGVNSSASQSANSATAQPAGAYPSTTQTSGGVYNNSNTASTSYQANNSQQASYGNYAQQQQQQQPSTYQSYNNKLNATSSLTDSSNSVSSLRVDLPNANTPASSRPPITTTSAANKPSGTALAPASSSGLPNLPPGVPMLGPGSFIMGQAPGLPYYAAAAAGMQQHPVYSLEDVQYRYPHLTAGYYDMGYNQQTSLGAGREGPLNSLAYAGSDAKFSRNENNSPVPTSLSQNAAQSHGGAFITPAAAAAAPLTPAYAYYYSGGVMPGGYQFGAPAALYPVSAAASVHAGSGAAAQYGKGGPLGGSGAATAQSGQTTGSGTGGGPSSATASYASYGSTYDDFSKSVYASVGVGNASGPTAKIGGVGAPAGPSGVGTAGSADLGGVGPNVYGKTHSQLGKINTYDKSGGFHTGTPPPYGLAGNATGAPLGVGVSVGVGGPSPYGAQHMFIPTLAHQSQHSHLMHQQLHQDSTSGPGQRSQTGGQQNKSGSKPSYGGSYWGSN